jgi:class 3 adenylate cyclase
MAGAGLDRTFAAILSADVVDFSGHMRRDEEGTLKQLSELLGIAGEVVARHSGRLFGQAGDSFMARFASPVEAVRCAVTLHVELARAQAERPAPAQLKLRIGINLDDVICEGDGVYGDGVNIAARLQSLAEAGGTVVGQAVYDHVRTHTATAFERIGRRSIKNMAEPITAYRITRASSSGIRRWSRRKKRLAALAVGMMLVVAFTAVLLGHRPLVTSITSLREIAPAPPAMKRPLHDRQVPDWMSETALRWGDGAA